MESMYYIKIIAFGLGVGLLVIGLIDYVRCKSRKWGENPKKWGKK